MGDGGATASKKTPETKSPLAIWVLAETVGGHVHKATFELLGDAKKLATVRKVSVDLGWIPHERQVGQTVATRGSSLNYFTDAAVLKPALGNPPTVVVGPGDPAQAHQTDEHVAVGRISEAENLYVDIGTAWLTRENEAEG